MGTQVRGQNVTQLRGEIGMKLEVVAIPVSDVDRAKQYYEGLGWRLDGDGPAPARLSYGSFVSFKDPEELEPGNVGRPGMSGYEVAQAFARRCAVGA